MRLSISKIKAFKACRRMYQLRYVEGLKPVQKSEALETGTNYHHLLDEMYKGNFQPMVEDDWSKENAMAHAYYQYIYPRFKVVESEKWLEYDLGNGDILVGIADGIAEDGCIVEHKTSGLDITESYEYGLQWDEQILAYMLMTGMRKVHYTVVKKPTIRLKQNETDEEFYKRMIAWYDEETDTKIRLIEIERTDDDVEQFRKELLSIKATMQDAEQDRNYYKNTCHCEKYGKRCEYSSVCLHYDPNAEYLEFIKEEKDGVKED